VRAGVVCSPCFKKQCDDRQCMRQITVDMVYEAVKEGINA